MIRLIVVLGCLVPPWYGDGSRCVAAVGCKHTMFVSERQQAKVCVKILLTVWRKYSCYEIIYYRFILAWERLMHVCRLG